MSIPPSAKQPPDAAEPGATPPDTERVQRGGRWLAWLVVVGVAGAALGVLQVTGGLTAVPLAPTPVTGLRTVPVGRPIDVGPATITVTGVVALSDLGEVVGAPDAGNRFVVVAARVEVTDHRTWDRLSDSIRISGVPGLVATTYVEARLIAGSQRADSLQPGLPADVAVIFEQALSSPVPASVAVTVVCWQRSSDEFGDWWWLDERPCASVTVETEDRTVVASATPSPVASP